MLWGFFIGDSHVSTQPTARQGKTSRAAGGELQLAPPCGRMGNDASWPMFSRIRRRLPRFEQMFFPQQMSEEPEMYQSLLTDGISNLVEGGEHRMKVHDWQEKSQEHAFICHRHAESALRNTLVQFLS